MPDEVAAIRLRWAGVRWIYAQKSLSESYVGEAWVYESAGRGMLLDLDEPSGDEIAFLRLVAQAPADIRALLGRIDELLNEARGDSLTIVAAAQRYRAAVRAMDGIAAAEAALFTALDAVEGAP